MTFDETVRLTITAAFVAAGKPAWHLFCAWLVSWRERRAQASGTGGAEQAQGFIELSAREEPGALGHESGRRLLTGPRVGQ